jgi:hypothetical protein
MALEERGRRTAGERKVTKSLGNVAGVHRSKTGAPAVGGRAGEGRRPWSCSPGRRLPMRCRARRGRQSDTQATHLRPAHEPHLSLIGKLIFDSGFIEEKSGSWEEFSRRRPSILFDQVYHSPALSILSLRHEIPFCSCHPCCVQSGSITHRAVHRIHVLPYKLN